jgi:hypothetical protein
MSKLSDANLLLGFTHIVQIVRFNFQSISKLIPMAVILPSVLLVSNAHALSNPGLGTYATYSYLSQAPKGPIYKGTQTDSVISVNPTNLVYQLQTEIQVAGQVNATSLWNVSGNYFDDTIYFIEHCKETGGNNVKFHVPAGDFETCHIVFKHPDRETLSLEAWLSTDVPLFTVKQIRKASDTNQTQISISLLKFVTQK